MNPAKRLEVRLKIAATKRGSLNPNWVPNVERICRQCKKAFETKPYLKKQICSIECQREWARKRMLGTTNPSRDPALNKRGAELRKWNYRHDEAYRNRILASRFRHPNNLERDFDIFAKDRNLPLTFVGDWTFWVGPCKSGKCRNPDFIHINRHLKLAIQVGARYHHMRTWQEELDDYESIGWRAVYVWEDEFRTNPELIYRRVLDFIGLVVRPQ